MLLGIIKVLSCKPICSNIYSNQLVYVHAQEVCEFQNGKHDLYSVLYLGFFSWGFEISPL